jgi:hypothetical protein
MILFLIMVGSKIFIFLIKNAYQEKRDKMVNALKKYIPEDGNTGEPCPNCGEKSLVYQEGCMVCLQCSASKCG